MARKNHLAKLKNLRLVLLDVDGVLTDGRIVFGSLGLAISEMKFFDSHDGYGIRRAIDNGLGVAILTSRRSELVEARAIELGIADVYQGVEDKLKTYAEIKHLAKLTDGEICFIGDDIPDLALLKTVGFSAAPGDAVDEIRSAVDYVALHNGGRGAVREILDMILKAQKKLQ